MGFADPARAERLLLTDLGVRAVELRTDPLVTAIAVAADPDLAVAGLARLFGAAAGRDAPSRDVLRAALRAEEDFRDRLTAVLGVSTGLADHLARHPEDAGLLRGAITRPDEAELRAGLLRAVGADPGDPGPGGLDGPVAAGQEPTAALAAAYRRRLLHLTARDLTSAVAVDEGARNWPTSRPRSSKQRSPWRGPNSPPAPSPPAWPSWPWASAAAASSTTPATST